MQCDGHDGDERLLYKKREEKKRKEKKRKENAQKEGKKRPPPETKRNPYQHSGHREESTLRK